MAREHLVVCRNPEPGATGWCMATGAGQLPAFRVMSSGATKRVWAEEVVRTAIAQDLALDLTITDAPPAAALADPDAVPDGYHLALVCREGVPGGDRWAVLVMDKKGDFRLNGIEAGKGVEFLLEKLAAETTEGPFDKSILWFRPGFHAEDLLPAAKGGRR
jgi:hypothetical protein